MTTARTWYAVLGVAVDATRAEIEHAFRALLRRHHPDTRQRGDEAEGVLSDAALQDVFAAYAVLGDPDRRAHYDRELAASRRPAPSRPRTAAPRAGHLDARPPIIAGPVRWHVRHRGPSGHR